MNQTLQQKNHTAAGLGPILIEVCKVGKGDC